MAWPSKRAVGVAALFGTLAGWSSTPLFLVHFAAQIDAWTSNGWRYGFAALLWLPVLVALRARRRWPTGLLRRAAVPAVFNAAGQMAFAESFYHVDPATAIFGLRLQIVFVALGAWLLFPAERRVLRSSDAWAGVALVLAGIAGTVWLAPGARPRGELMGVALAVAAGLLFAAYGLAVRHRMGGDSALAAFAAISQWTALAMVAAMVVWGRDRGAAVVALPKAEQLLLAASAVAGIALGHVFYYLAMARLGVAVTAGVLQLQPFAVAAGGALLFGDELGEGQVAAGMVAVAGAVLLLRAQAAAQRAIKNSVADTNA